VTSAVWQDTIDTNLTGVWHTMVAAVPHLIGNGGGSIICISSTAGIKGLPFFAPYVAAKHGVVGLAKSMANELARHNIRVNSVHPTGVNTPMGTSLGALYSLLARDPNLGPIYMNALAVDPIEPRDVGAARPHRRIPARDARVLLLSDCVHHPFPVRCTPRSSGVCMAVIIVATAFPAPEHREEVIAAFEAAIGKVHAEEDGCELYALNEGPDGRLVMIEKYASDDAVAAHRAGAGLAALREALGGKLSAPMDVQVLAPHPAGSPAKGAL
jgi:quinol monooxygenase YgiN